MCSIFRWTVMSTPTSAVATQVRLNGERTWRLLQAADVCLVCEFANAHTCRMLVLIARSHGEYTLNHFTRYYVLLNHICAVHFARCVLVHRLNEHSPDNHTLKRHKCNSLSALPYSNRRTHTLCLECRHTAPVAFGQCTCICTSFGLDQQRQNHIHG